MPKNPLPHCPETNPSEIDAGTLCRSTTDSPSSTGKPGAAPSFASGFDLQSKLNLPAGFAAQCTAGISTSQSLLLMDLRPLLTQGIRFVFRYYKPTLNNRYAISGPEAEYISAHGLTIGIVYEGEPATENSGVKAGYFSLSDPAKAYKKGQEHAKRACSAAQALGQPAGSAIYFAVDFDAVMDPTLDTVTNAAFCQYFAAVGDYLKGYSYAIGAYGSGALCSLLLRQPKLVEYTWLAESSGWAGSKTFANWNVKQSRPRGDLGNLGTHYEWCEASGNFGGFKVTPCHI